MRQYTEANKVEINGIARLMDALLDGPGHPVYNEAFNGREKVPSDLHGVYDALKERNPTEQGKQRARSAAVVFAKGIIAQAKVFAVVELKSRGKIAA